MWVLQGTPHMETCAVFVLLKPLMTNLAKDDRRYVHHGSYHPHLTHPATEHILQTLDMYMELYGHVVPCSHYRMSRMSLSLAKRLVFCPALLLFPCGLVGLHASSACMPMGHDIDLGHPDVVPQSLWVHTMLEQFSSAIDKVTAGDRQRNKNRGVAACGHCVAAVAAAMRAL